MAHIKALNVILALAVLSGGLFGCSKEDELGSGPAIVGVSLPADLTIEAGWAVVAVDVLQNDRLTTIYPDVPTTSVEVSVQSGSSLGVAITAVHTQSQSLGWYRGTQELVPIPGSQPLDLGVQALPTKEVTVMPSLRDQQAEADIEYGRDFAIIFADLETGFVTNPLFKTRQTITLPADVNLFGFFLSIDVHGQDLGIFQMDTSLVGIDHHDGMVTIDHHDGLVAIDHHDGLEVDELSIDHHDGMTLNELGIDHHDGLTPAVVSWKSFRSQLPAGEFGVSMGSAPLLPNLNEDGSTEPATATEVTPGEVILQELEGFPQMDTSFAIECAESSVCDDTATFQSCANSVVIAEDTTFQVRYQALVDLGCVEFTVRTAVIPSDSCTSATTCGDSGYCSCTEECSAQACGASPECGSCGTCETGYCTLGEGGAATCVDACMFNGGAEMVDPLGNCVMGRFIYVCQAGEIAQYQCLDDDNSDYQCMSNGDGIPVCGDTTCSPSCAELRVGQTDGCGHVCGVGVANDGLPCSDRFFGVCHPDGPWVTCEDGNYVFTDG